MSPRERVLKLRDSGWEACAGSLGPILAEAISAAEDEALERAALHIENDFRECFVSYVDQCTVAYGVRSLKSDHPDISVPDRGTAGGHCKPIQVDPDYPTRKEWS